MGGHQEGSHPLSSLLVGLRKHGLGDFSIDSFVILPHLQHEFMSSHAAKDRGGSTQSINCLVQGVKPHP